MTVTKLVIVAGSLEVDERGGVLVGELDDGNDCTAVLDAEVTDATSVACVAKASEELVVAVVEGLVMAVCEALDVPLLRAAFIMSAA